MMGVRCARGQAQREMNEMVDEFEGVLAKFTPKMRRPR
jgi:hypothetical protein